MLFQDFVDFVNLHLMCNSSIFSYSSNHNDFNIVYRGYQMSIGLILNTGEHNIILFNEFNKFSN